MKKWIALTAVIAALCGAGYYLLGAEINKGASSTADGTNDYLIILGAQVRHTGEPSLSLQARLETATAYLHDYPHVKVIVSGGQGRDEPATEASVMADYLIEKGIAAERILLEEASTSTYENLLFSKELLPADIATITIASNDYHLQRAKFLAEVVGLEADVLAAGTPTSVEAKSRMRERLALLKTYVFGK
ncbi:YdcF family protein [Metasolibacillus meyeri]|uniref:YdcF family protein n=1 Tax=Metasolibacillus meyeri TaxID=1071052 RepID=UPI000D3174F4|nr:YdcF family protein [Metasolibacillus meyeri]